MKQYIAKPIISAAETGDTSTTVRTGKGRVNYPYLAQPHAYNAKDREVYSMTFLFDKNDQHSKDILDKAIKNAVDKGIERYGPQFTNIRNPINDGDDKGDESYHDQWYINAKNPRRPAIYDENREEMDPEDIYSGCYVRCVMEFYPYSFTGNNGIAASLRSVQFLEDGNLLYVIPRSSADD